jgi:hypothetical protein
MLIIEDIWTAIDKARETSAQLQLDIANKSKYSGDIDIFDKMQLKSTALMAYVDALSNYDLHESIETDEMISTLVYNIKLLTKDLRQWG